MYEKNNGKTKFDELEEESFNEEENKFISKNSDNDKELDLES